MNYKQFLDNLDNILNTYCKEHQEHIKCKKGCSLCCTSGDYPMSQLEFDYLMQGYLNVNEDTKSKIKKNIKNMQKGGACPFLFDNHCTIYPYRPIICRVYGLAFKSKNIVKLPDCANKGKNYSSVFDGEKLSITPIMNNLDTPEILKGIDYGEIRNLYDWLR